MRKKQAKLNAKLSRKSLSWLKRQVNELHSIIDSVVQMLIVEYETHASLSRANTATVHVTTA